MQTQDVCAGFLFVRLIRMGLRSKANSSKTVQCNHWMLYHTSTRSSQTTGLGLVYMYLMQHCLRVVSQIFELAPTLTLIEKGSRTVPLFECPSHSMRSYSASPFAPRVITHWNLVGLRV